MTVNISPTEFQSDILSAPEDHHLFLGGGRGGGKTFGVILLIIDHVQRYGAVARVLITRKRQRSLGQLINELRSLLPTEWKFNGGDLTFRHRDGGTIQCAHCENQAAVVDIAQGLSFSMCFIDEACEAPSVDVIDSLMLSLRAPVPFPRLILAANPGGKNHAVLSERYVLGRRKYDAFTVGAEQWLYLPSTVDMNPHLDERYRRKFETLRVSDPARYQAMRNGDWSAIVGQFFERLWNAERMVVPANALSPRHFQSLRIGGDWGTASPAPFLLGGKLTYDLRLPDDRVLPKGAVVLADEHVEVDPNSLAKGSGRSPTQIAPSLWALARRWETRPRGWIDSAADARTVSFSQIKVTELFRASGVSMFPCRKTGTRADRFGYLRELMATDMFFVSDRCRYWLQTVPSLARDETNSEVPLKGSTDHAADATTYLISMLKTGQATGRCWRNPARMPPDERIVVV